MNFIMDMDEQIFYLIEGMKKCQWHFDSEAENPRVSIVTERRYEEMPVAFR
ncbi:MAG: hypothetical protein J5711_03880 [Bacteroidales bacterium]|nr:hypothetical protein [Bacteroidales bacterium]